MEIWIGIEFLRIGDPPLPHERPEGAIGEADAIAADPALLPDAITPAFEDRQPGLAVDLPLFTGVAIGVFEPIQMVLERTVIGADPRLGIAAVEQTLGSAWVRPSASPPGFRPALCHR